MSKKMKSRRLFINRALTTLAGGLLAKPVFGKNSLTKTVSFQDLPSLKGRKVLFTWGGWKGHEPEKFLNHFKPWIEEEGAEVVAYNSLEPYTDAALMNAIDIVIQVFTMSQISKEQEKGLLEAIKNGAGMAGWHGGMCDAFRQNVEYQFMTGGQWVAHPGGIIDYIVNITDQNDPVTKGLKDFKMTSEQYYMHVDPNMKVMATTTFNADHAPWIAGCVIPVCWKKMYGKGRIFYTSLGHHLSHITEVPEAAEMIKRGIKWASASKYDSPEPWVSPVYPV